MVKRETENRIAKIDSTGLRDPEEKESKIDTPETEEILIRIVRREKEKMIERSKGKERTKDREKGREKKERGRERRRESETS